MRFFLMLSRHFQHLFKTFLQCVVTRLLSSIIVCLVNAAENITVRTRASRKLGYERAQQVAAAFLVEIPGIEVKIGHDG